MRKAAPANGRGERARVIANDAYDARPTSRSRISQVGAVLSRLAVHSMLASWQPAQHDCDMGELVSAAASHTVRQPLRVLVGVHDGSVSGINTYIEHVAAAAATAVTDVTLLVADDVLAGDVNTRLAGTGVRVVSLAMAPPAGIEAFRLRASPAFAAHRLRVAVQRMLRRDRSTYDAVHLNHPHLAFAMRPAAPRICVAAWFYPHSLGARVLSTWDNSGRRFPRSGALALKGALHYRNDARGYRDATVVVAPTQLLAAQLRRCGIAAVQCTPPARVLDAGPATAPAAGARPRLLVCCGDLGHPRKNIALAIDSLCILGARGAALELELIGGNADALAPQLRGLPASVTVTRRGRVSAREVHARMRAAHALLFPSRYEEWGYVAVEAALHGTPVVTLPVYPFAEMLNPPLGVRAAGASAAEFADAVAGLLDSPPERVAVAARAEERFGLVTTGRALADVWSDRHAAEPSSRHGRTSRPEPLQPTVDGRMSR